MQKDFKILAEMTHRFNSGYSRGHAMRVSTTTENCRVLEAGDKGVHKGVQSPFSIANKKALEWFGEFGIATCSEEEMNKIIRLSSADKLAREIFGEFGFSTLGEEEMKELLNSNPKLVR